MAYVESLSKKSGLIGCEESKKIIPFLISVDPEGKKQIFGQWSEACRWAGQDKCNVQLDSVKTTVETLDRVAGSIFKIP